jgi:hypothetical protein
VWLVDTGGSSTHDVGWYLDGVRRVLRAVATAPVGTAPARRRARHLVALPLVGVGAGGASGRRGEMIGALLDVLEEHANAGHDVALVLSTARDHCAVQHVRRGRVKHDLATAEVDAARRLAQYACAGELALFLGAGVSVSAGLPTWGALLEQLASRTSLSNGERAGLATLPPQDAATLIEMSLEEPLVDALGERPRDDAPRPVPRPARRASGARGRDDQLRRAPRAGLGAVGHEPAVLPFDPPSSRHPWVLKLHGDLERKSGVVLTRSEMLDGIRPVTDAHPLGTPGSSHAWQPAPRSCRPRRSVRGRGRGGREAVRAPRRRLQQRRQHRRGRADRGLPVGRVARTLQVHALGAFHMIKHTSPHLGEGASIIITSSVVGLMGYGGISGYVAAKHAQVGMMRAAAKELTPRRIRVNSLHSGPTSTPFEDSIEMRATGLGQAEAAAAFDDLVPLGRHATPQEIARTVVYLASDDSASTTGAPVAVDGGLTL